jgi:hypothetical protein
VSLALLALTTLLVADAPTAALPPPVPAEALAAWTDVLKTHVSARGLVDYRAIAARDLAKLDQFLSAVASAPVPGDKDVALALYADAYNARVIRQVIDAGYPRSVLDVKGFFDAKSFKVAGQEVTLDRLEKKLAAPLGSPLHHFVFVCGAVGCPRIEPKPLLGTSVRARATAAAKAYLATPRGASVRDGELELSKIFEWYAADFGGPAGVLTFARAHLPPDAAAKLGATPKVKSLEYDWTLNQP